MYVFIHLTGYLSDHLYVYDGYYIIVISDEEDGEQFYRDTFYELTSNKEVMSLSELFQWDELQDLIDDSLISIRQLNKLYDSFPQIQLFDEVTKSTVKGLLLSMYHRPWSS